MGLWQCGNDIGSPFAALLFYAFLSYVIFCDASKCYSTAITCSKIEISQSLKVLYKW